MKISSFMRGWFGRSVVYIHPVYLTSGRLQQVQEVLLRIALDNWLDDLVRLTSTRSVLFDPAFGLVGTGDGSLIRIES